MTTVGATGATTRFPELLDRVVQGEEIVITRDGRPAARFVPAEVRPTPHIDKATADELLAIGREFRAMVKGDFSSVDVNEILYDADGLPR